MSENRKPFETYAHYKIGKGFATLAVSVDDGLVRVGVSYCHPRDNLNKRFGRGVASSRRDIGSDFSFEFKRLPGQRLTEQLRAEFEHFVAGSTNALTVRGSAPPWIVHSLNRELRKRNRTVSSENGHPVTHIDCDAFDLSRTHGPCCC